MTIAQQTIDPYVGRNVDWKAFWYSKQQLSCFKLQHPNGGDIYHELTWE